MVIITSLVSALWISIFLARAICYPDYILGHRDTTHIKDILLAYTSLRASSDCGRVLKAVRPTHTSPVKWKSPRSAPTEHYGSSHVLCNIVSRLPATVRPRLEVHIELYFDKAFTG